MASDNFISECYAEIARMNEEIEKINELIQHLNKEDNTLYNYNQEERIKTFLQQNTDQITTQITTQE